MGLERSLVHDLDLAALLRTLAENDGSDLHLKVGSPPLIRVDGLLQRLEGPRLTPQDTQLLAQSIMPPDRRGWLEQKKETDFALSVPGVGRFRANVFYQRGSITLVLRRVRVGSQSFEDLGLPPVVQQLAEAPRGLILVTGPTGAGKTTTLAAMIDHINANRACHIVTIEEPIEVLHPDRVATVNQREIGMDTDSYEAAMRAVVRQDPDVILIGEMRDPETVWAALAGGGRIPAVEVMVNNGRIADRIMDAARTAEIHEIIAEGDYYGMQTFDQSLLGMVRQNLISIDDALHASSQPHDFLLMLEQAGLRTMDRSVAPAS